MDLLLLSNSKLPGMSYLEYAVPPIKAFIGQKRKAVFIPYAGVTQTHDQYTDKVQKALADVAVDVHGVHTFADPVQAIADAEIVIVGGGNTFNLLKVCRELGLIKAIQDKIAQGGLYIGWSAGANLACPSICTTNDMPIVDPKGFDALNLISLQINPHYNNALPPGHQGETRDDRIIELLAVNPEIKVIGVPEGDWLEVHGDAMTLCGSKSAVYFESGKDKIEVQVGHRWSR